MDERWTFCSAERGHNGHPGLEEADADYKSWALWNTGIQVQDLLIKLTQSLAVTYQQRLESLLTNYLKLTFKRWQSDPTVAHINDVLWDVALPALYLE